MYQIFSLGAKYDQDAIHPYLIDGKKALARAWISGLKNIHPIID